MNRGDEVRVVAFDIPFLQLVWLMIKIAFAAIPAGIIAILAWFFLGSFLRGFFFGSGS